MFYYHRSHVLAEFSCARMMLHVLTTTVVSHIYAYDRAKTLSFALLIRRKSTEFDNESNV